MNTQVTAIETAAFLWNDDVVADNDAQIEAIEIDIAKMKADLSRLSEKDEQDDILFM